MPTETEIKLERYSKVEREADAFGRVIGVRRLKPSERARVTGMIADISGEETGKFKDPETGEDKDFSFPNRAPFFLAAAVCEIDTAKIPFPKSRGELDAIYDRLDTEGVLAAGIAIGRLVGTDLASAEEEAKN